MDEEMEEKFIEDIGKRIDRINLGDQSDPLILAGMTPSAAVEFLLVATSARLYWGD